MDAPAEQGEDVRPSCASPRHLTGCGLSAPRDPGRRCRHTGLLLLEDLGDALFARVLAATRRARPSSMPPRPMLLAALQRRPRPGRLPAYDARDHGASRPALAYDRYWLGRRRRRCRRQRRRCRRRAGGRACGAAALVAGAGAARLSRRKPVLAARARRVSRGSGCSTSRTPGSAIRPMIWSRCCSDARRDVSPETEAAMIARLLRHATGMTPRDSAPPMPLLSARSATCGSSASLPGCRCDHGKPHYRRSHAPRLGAI